MNIKNIVNEAVRKTLLEEVDNFNKVTYYRNDSLNESSINRMLQWLKNCDCAFITAFRNELTDIRNDDATYFGPSGDWEEGKVFSHEENRKKNKIMASELILKGYGVTKIKGVYPEGMTDESSEESYLVVNRNNDPNFLSNVLKIAEYYNQDSIYYKEAGAEVGHLIGTNGSDGVVSYHEKDKGSKLKIGTASNYMSRLGNTAFSFIGSTAEKTKDRKSAMDSIENSRGTDDEYNQRYWTDNDRTSFQARKEQRKKKLSEAVSFWRNIVVERMKITEKIHPLTRKMMCEAIHEYKDTH